MKLKHLLLLLMTVVSFSATRAADEWKDVKFNPDVRYSQLVLDSRLGDFYGNTNTMGFATYNQDLSEKKGFPTWSSSKGILIDYVAGLVAKAAVEATILYQDYDWSKPWFKSVESYANHERVSVPTGGGSLDDLNAAKMYFGLYTLATTNDDFAKIAASTTVSNAKTQLKHAMSGLTAHNGGNAFASGTKLGNNDISGGWFHKSIYENQMWLDGQYMGPALLAELINDKKTYTAITADDWGLVAKQFTIVWNQCWDDKEKLLYHAFTSVANKTWAEDGEVWTTRKTDTSNWTGMTAGGHSAAFWGRAEGWYLLALVDVLEQMPTSNSNYTTLKGYLNTLAAGIAARQDATTGCWYQLVGKPGNYTAQYYNGDGPTTVTNYLESSCTAIFAAAYLKGARLGLFVDNGTDNNAKYKEIGEKAYAGLVNQFMKQRTDGTVDLFGCCRSAGLGTDALKAERFRDGSNAYYLHGYDIIPTPQPYKGKDGHYTEGKVLGAFILAATEYERINHKEHPVLLTLDTPKECTLDGSKALKVAVTDNGTATYLWYKDDDPISDATSAEYTPTKSGTYCCKITVTNALAAKGRAVSNDDGTYTIKSTETVVTVAESGDNNGVSDATYEYWFANVSDAQKNFGQGASQSTNFFSNTPGGSNSASGTFTIDGKAYTITKRSSEGSISVTFSIPEGKEGYLHIVARSSSSTPKIFYLTKGTDSPIEIGQTSTSSNTLVAISHNTQLSAGNYTLTAEKVCLSMLLMKLENAGGTGPDPTADSDLKITEGTNYTKNSNTWTPAVNGTIDLSELVTSSSTGAYSITSGEAATLSGTTLTAVKSGTVTLTQAADATHKAGSVNINVAIGDNVTDNTVNAYTFPTSSETVVSDGMTMALKDITMTFGNDGFWKKAGTNNGYTSGQNGPKPGKGDVPTSGTYYKFVPAKDGSLAVNISIGANKRLYVVESDATPIEIEAKDKDGNVVTGSASAAGYTGDVTFNVAANKTYYVYVDGSKANFYGFAFTPSTETPVEGNVIATFVNPVKPTWECNEKNGVKITDITELTDNTSAAKIAPSGEITMTIPKGVTVTKIIVNVSSNGSNSPVLLVNEVSSSGLSKSYTDVTYDFSLSPIVGETTVSFKHGSAKDNLQIKQVLVYGEDKTAESNSTATFSYDNSALTFTKVESAENTYETTLEVGADKKGTDLSIALSTAEGATVVCDNGGNVSNETKTVTVTAPEKVADPVTYTVTVTSADGTSTTTYKITVKLKKTAIVLKYVLNDNSEDATEERKANAEWFWDKLANPSKEFTVNTLVLKAYNASGDEISLPSGITYESDMPSVAKVDRSTGVITPVGNSLGRAYIYATFAGNAEYAAAETRCAVYIRDGYTYNVADADKSTTPKLNEFRYITDKDGNNLLRMKFGGWKWNKGKYIKPTVGQGSNWSSTSDDDYVTDSWGKLADSGVTGIDGFTQGFPGTNDACDESMKPSTHYNSTRYGWFKAPSDENNNLHDPNGITETYPFTLPVRGSYMTFEPMVNGTLSVFIIQNGAWNTWNKDGTYNENGVKYTYKSGDIKKGEFRPHSFQIVNQRGLTLSQFATKWSVDTKQKVTDKYYCDPDDETHNSEGILSPNVADWPEFNDGRLTDGERADIVAAWTDPERRDMQKIVMLHDGSFLAVEKGIVKYTFHVTGHETYYFFSNFSKMGFCGANFTPDADTAQPTATLELDDQVAYPTFNSTLIKNEQYEGNPEMKRWDVEKKDFLSLPKINKHTFTVTKADGQTIDGVNVAGAQAPQFKTITVQRDFKQGQWTTLTLPFNMTQKKVEEVFGVGTELLLLKSSEMNGSAVRLHFIYHEIQNVLPGYPYLIKPTLVDAKGNNYSNGTTDVSTIVETDGALVLTSFNVPVKHITQAAKQLTFGESGPYILKGVENYCTPDATDKSPFSVNLKGGDVFLSDSNGKFYVSKGASYCKGYRAYMTTADPQVTPAKSVILTYSGVEDNPDNGTATEISIAELSPEAVMALGLKGVYNLSGQKVADTADNLPAGIYVVNGQKIVVK